MKPNVASILELAQKLIGIASEGEIGSSEELLHEMYGWCAAHDLPAKILTSSGRPAAMLCRLSGSSQRPKYCLNACGDTAPIGDVTSWRFPPTSGEIVDGWMYGRGSADSKIAISIFAHLMADLKVSHPLRKATLDFLIDGDEHTGHFTGIKTYLRNNQDVSGVFIGYPGNENIARGARGFLRATVNVFGTAEHSGSRNRDPENAAKRAACLIHKLYEREIFSEVDDSFPLDPKLSVTAIHGGKDFSTIPEECSVQIDVRLTPSFDSTLATAFLKEVVAEVDEGYPTRRFSSIVFEESWPAYKLADSSLLLKALQEAALQTTGRFVPAVVCGPSNIGNYLATCGVEATCGFGVSFRNIHAPNEAIEISTIPMVYQTYFLAIKKLIAGNPE